MEPSNIIDKLSSLTILPEVYKDLAKPGIRKTGMAIGDALEFVFLPIRLMKHGHDWIDIHLKKHLERVAKKLDEIPEEKIVEVPKEIAVPLLQKLSYTTNEQVAELYVNLLASAANENTASNAHPAFVQMIERLSADEAKIIDFLKDIDELNYLHLQVNYGPPKFKQAYYLKYVSELDELNLYFPKNVTAYLSNLVSMGILTDIKTSYLKHQQYVLNKLKEKNKLKFEDLESQIKNTDPNSSLVWIQSYFEITPFGYLFICACTGVIFSEIRVIIDDDDFIID